MVVVGRGNDHCVCVCMRESVCVCMCVVLCTYTAFEGVFILELS